MAHHLEFVYGPLGEETRLACACPREGSHPRPNSASRVADELGAATVAAVPARRGEPLRRRRSARHRA